jgi:PncC family amidohydrolase
MQETIERISSLLKEKKLYLASAESCTGGMIAASITDIPGSSDVFDRGFVTYSNTAKQEMLGVSASTIEKYGAVSKECAREMVLGALNNSLANIAVSVTGIAGPSGGTQGKPVGLVYIATCLRDNIPDVVKCNFEGDRMAVRMLACDKAFHLLAQAISAV